MRRTAVEAQLVGVLLISVATWYFISQRDRAPETRTIPADARRDFEQARSLFYLGAFPQSLEARQRAVASFNSEAGPEIHQIWGDLGDSYRRTSQPQAAADDHPDLLNQR